MLHYRLHGKDNNSLLMPNKTLEFFILQIDLYDKNEGEAAWIATLLPPTMKQFFYFWLC